jgi:endoglucanase
MISLAVLLSVIPMTSIKGLTVQGTQLLTPDGSPIHLRGFNAMWWVAPSREHARLMRSMGANTARYMFGRSTTGRPVSKVDEIVEHVERLTDAGLWVIPTVHDFRTDGKAPYDDAEVQKEFLEMWQGVVLRLRGNPLIAAWEPMNEPHDASAEKVSQWYAELIPFFRGLDSHRPIVVEGTGYSWPQNLEDGLIQKDSQIIYSFHTYGPWEYASQKQEAGIPYPGKWIKKDLADGIRPAAEFRDRHQVPVWCGEWGVPSGLPGAFEWIDDVGEVLEEFRIPWTYWTWAEKPEKPLDSTFDVNPKKEALYRHMSALFRRTAKKLPSVRSVKP